MHFYKNISKIGNNLIWKEIKDGKSGTFTRKIKPSLYVPDSVPSTFKDWNGLNLKEIKFDNSWERSQYLKTNGHAMKFHGTANDISDFITRKYPEDIQYDPNLINIGYFDIEVAKNDRKQYANVDTAEGKITAICLIARDNVYVWSYKDYIVNPEIAKTYNITYIKCSSEVDLVEDFFNHINKLEIDILTGWNVEGYDIPYLVTRSTRLIGFEETQKKFSPFNKITTREYTEFNKIKKIYTIHGLTVLDYMVIYKKFGKDRENLPDDYKLNTVAYFELKEKKIDYSSFESLDKLYTSNFQLFIDYNIQDTILVQKLEKKKLLLSLAITLAYKTKVPYSDILMQTVMWDSLCYNYMFHKGIMIPFKKRVEDKSIEGAYVKEPVPGLYKWTLSYDIQSLYPNIMRSLNVGPDTVHKKLHTSPDEILLYGNKHKDFALSENVSVAANGNTFRRDKPSFLTELITKLFNERKMFKTKQLEAKSRFEKSHDPADDLLSKQYKIIQEAIKVTLNSLYGSLGQAGFRFYDPDLAEAITLTGQAIIRHCAKNLNTKINQLLNNNIEKDYTITCDTDSVYIDLKDFNYSDNIDDVTSITDIIDNMCKTDLDPFIEGFLREFADEQNFYTNEIKLIRDVIANKAVWQAKKRYFMNVIDAEGVRYAKPELKIMGIEAIKSSTPEICRKAFKEIFTIIVEGDKDKFYRYINEFRDTFKQQPFTTIALPKSCNGISDYFDSSSLYKKGTPFHVRGAIMYNYHLRRHGLENTYEVLNDGDKIKYCYLRMPNPIHENVIAVSTILPSEFGLNDYIDYNLQFEKSFLEPLHNVTESFGWGTMRQRATLEDLFN